MKTTYANFIKYLREEKKLSQVAVAKNTDMSRASYVAVEKGTKELTLSEAESLTKLFGISIDDLLRTHAPNLKKYQQMILKFLREAKVNKIVLKKTKLAQLLYLADISTFYVTNKSMSGLSYRRIDFGPTADEYFRILEEMEQGGIINIKQIYRDDYHMYEIEETRGSSKKNLDCLNNKESVTLVKILKQWADASTAEIVKFTTEQLPYKSAQAGEIIKYDSIKDEDAHNIY